MVVNKHPRLLQSLYQQYKFVVKFTEDDLVTLIQQWPIDLMTLMEKDAGDSETEEETSYHGEPSGNDKYKDE